MALKVLIVMGSDSDLDHVLPAATVLKEFEIPVEVAVASAHRSPDRVIEMARAARGRGFGVVIAAAGGAAHLAGVFAANTTLGGVDALLSSVQMPGGVPIASVGIGGAKNAGNFAAAILSVSDPALAARLDAFRQREAAKVVEADGRVKAKISGS